MTIWLSGEIPDAERVFQQDQVTPCFWCYTRMPHAGDVAWGKAKAALQLVALQSFLVTLAVQGASTRHGIDWFYFKFWARPRYHISFSLGFIQLAALPDSLLYTLLPNAMIMWFIWIVPVDRVMMTWFGILHCEGNTGDGDDTEKEATQRKPVWVSSLNTCFLQIWLHWKKSAQTKDHGTTLYTGGFIALLCVAMKAWKTKSVCLAPLKAVAAKAVWSYCG